MRVFLVLGLLASSLSAQTGDPALGRQIYQQGLLPSGKPMQVKLIGDVEVPGTTLNCMSCHRRSGYGASEGGSYVPDISATALFATQTPSRDHLFRSLYQEIQAKPVRARVHYVRERAAYTPASLATLLREGVDPNGHKMLAPMPRFVLNDEDISHLVAYLHTLNVEHSPGVDAHSIHFATIITPEVARQKKQAMLKVIRAYEARKNAAVQHYRIRANASLWYKKDLLHAYRQWQMHVWELKGAAKTWPAQLQKFYQTQAVFAVLSGMGDADWTPIHQFCEEYALPCLFPNTNLPVTTAENNYNLYLSRGLSGEAEMAANFLSQKMLQPGSKKTVQVYRAGSHTANMAEKVRQVFTKAKLPLETIQLQPEQVLDDDFWAALPSQAVGAVLLWLPQAELVSLGNFSGPIVLSSTLLSDENAWYQKFPNQQILLTWPHTLPGMQPPRIYRLRAWFRSRKIPLTFEAMQLNTYFALSVADHALDHLVDRFSRDYLIETIEHETENALNPGIFPRLSLGPGQRFAAKGGYVVRLTAQGVEAVSGWLPVVAVP